MPVNEAHRPYFEYMRMLSRDALGRETLVGLNYDETEWYFADIDYDLGYDSSRPFRTVAQRTADRERFLALYERHEQARLRVVLQTTK